MKLVELDSTVRVECCEESPVGLGDRTEEGLAERLCRIVRDQDSVRCLHALLGPYCHQSRNILNSLKLGLYLAWQQEPRDGNVAGLRTKLEREYQQVERLFDRLQTICRPITLTPVRLALSLLIEDRRSSWLTSFSSRGGVLELIAPVGEEAGNYDPHWLGQALDAFVLWRAESSSGPAGARLHWRTEQGRFEIEWTETEPMRGMESEGGPVAAAGPPLAVEPIESLALPLLGRVISAHGGALEQVEPAGRHIRMSWPLTARLP